MLHHKWIKLKLTNKTVKLNVDNAHLNAEKVNGHKPIEHHRTENSGTKKIAKPAKEREHVKKNK